MLFPTLEFAVFFLLVYVLHWLLRPHERTWKIFLLVASYYFYGSWNAWYLLLIFAVTLFSFLFAAAIQATADSPRRRRYLWLGVLVCLSFLSYFKYYNFLLELFAPIFRPVGLELGEYTRDLILPVGISFFSFQAISFILDVHRGSLRYSFTVMGFIEYATYIAFFPQLVAGPIIRAGTFFPQFTGGARYVIPHFHRALALILGGLFKKMVLSTYLQTMIVDEVFANPLNHTPMDVLLSVYAFSVQIYCDFSGYSDIAIGVALLLGFTFPKNFNNPYRADSIQDFWLRWHMSLSQWLRDYLYIPLGGNRGRAWRTYRNVMITMLLGGLWHGASISFMVWGGMHGLIISLHRLWSHGLLPWLLARVPWRSARFAAWYRGLAIIATFHMVSFLWVFFYHTDYSNALDVFRAMGASWARWPEAPPLVWIAIIVGVGMNFLGGRVYRAFLGFQDAYNPYARIALNTALLWVIIALSPDIIPPFIYFQF